MQRCLATMNCPEYFAMVEHRLQQEEERACAVLDQATSKAKLLRLVDDVFVSQQVLRTPTSMLLALAAVHSGSKLGYLFLVSSSHPSIHVRHSPPATKHITLLVYELLALSATVVK